MVEIARDGWTSVRLADDLTVHVKAGRDRAGRVVATDVLISAPDVNSDVLRFVRPHRVLAAARADVTSSAVVDDRAGADDTKTTLGQLRSRAAPIRKTKRPRLGRPPLVDGDGFYEAVAKAYGSASVESSRPAMVLAGENRVPVETVRRWIREARRRGFLAPGRKGRSG